jgi:hypothetical protein
LNLIKKLFNREISRSEYAALVMARLAESGMAGLEFDEANFLIAYGGDGRVFLENGYSRYVSATPKDRKTVLAQFVAGSAVKITIPTEFGAAKDNLLPIIRSASYLSLTALEMRARDLSAPDQKVIASQPLANDLVVALAYDTERSISIINFETLQGWNAELGGALKAAQDNLRDATDPNALVERLPGVFVGQWNDSYESSRMLLTDMIHRLPLNGEPVAAIPCRDQFWVTGSRNREGIQSLVNVTKTDHLGAYPLSPYLFLLSDDGWTRFVPDDPELKKELESLERRRLALDYDLQKKYLEAIYERDSVDVFVASYTVYLENETARKYSTCVWSKDVDSLLPRTDEVILLVNREPMDRVKVTWATMQSVVGGLLEKQPELFPERYRVRVFPQPEKIADLRQDALR